MAQRCKTYSFAVDVVEENATSSTDDWEFTLGVPAVIHADTPIEGHCFAYCVFRIVECPIGCTTTPYEYELPLSCCMPILPPGKYKICFPEQKKLTYADVQTTLDMMLEDVDQTFIDIMALNCQ